MAINVYWAALEEEWLRVEPPESVSKSFFADTRFEETRAKTCPAVRDSVKNTYALKSIYDYEFSISDKGVSSSYWDQKFFDRHVVVRSLKEKAFSFNQWISLYTEEDSLLVTVNIFPYLEDNNISKRCIMFPGTYDIGKWFRNVEFAFLLRNEHNTFKIQENEVYQYIKFHTDEKINFIQYKHNEVMTSHMEDVMRSRQNMTSRGSLANHYKHMKNKKQILTEIKKNLI